MHRPEGKLLALSAVLVGAVFVSGVLQVVTGVIPLSVASTTPPWFDDFYTWLQVAAAAVLLVSYVPAVPDGLALRVEASGSLMMAGALGSYFAATFDAVSVPKSSGVWVIGALAGWCLCRAVLITVEFRRARLRLREG